MNRLKFSYNCRCASVAIVSKTIEDLPEPETPVTIVILRFGMRSETSLRLFSRTPRSSMNSFTLHLQGTGGPTRSSDLRPRGDHLTRGAVRRRAHDLLGGLNHAAADVGPAVRLRDEPPGAAF